MCVCGHEKSNVPISKAYLLILDVLTKSRDMRPSTTHLYPHVRVVVFPGHTTYGSKSRCCFQEFSLNNANRVSIIYDYY